MYYINVETIQTAGKTVLIQYVSTQWKINNEVHSVIFNNTVSIS